MIDIIVKSNRFGRRIACVVLCTALLNACVSSLDEDSRACPCDKSMYMCCVEQDRCFKKSEYGVSCPSGGQVSTESFDTNEDTLTSKQETGDDTETSSNGTAGTDSVPGGGTGTDMGSDSDTGSDSDSIEDTEDETDTGVTLDSEGGTDSFVGDTANSCAHPGDCVVYVNGQNTDAPNANGQSWETAFSAVQDGIDAAYDLAVGNPCEVRVAQGTYVPTGRSKWAPETETGSLEEMRFRSFVLRKGIQIAGGYAADSTLPCLRDIVLFPTILSGDNFADDGTKGTADNSYIVVWAEQNGALNGVIITGGRADHPGWDSWRSGAGVHIDERVFVTIANSTFRNNWASYRGGAISTTSQSGYLVVNSTFEKNSAGFGGAIFNNGDSALLPNKEVLNCRFVNNHAYNDGGAIYNAKMSIGAVTGSLFWGNGTDSTSGSSAGRGGAICNMAPKNIAITNCTLVENRALFGGAIYNGDADAETIHIFNSIIWENAQTTGFQITSDRATPIIAYSIVEDGHWTSSSDTDTVNGNWNSSQNPLFADTDFSLSPESSGINGGLNDVLPIDRLDLDADMDTDEQLPLDLAGENRVTNVIVDMGALEFAGAR
ncbi:MAG: hypothetical protein JXR76_06180 [Deltaproteobacteria bacterium]|nr:hypothetical protein [Deltaproteobacteria bacterium]